MIESKTKRLVITREAPLASSIITTPEAVALEGADDFYAGLFLDIVEDFHIAAETSFVKYETRTWNL